MEMPPDRLDIRLDPAWAAPQIAAAILDATRRTYGSTLDIDGMQSSMEEIWVDLHRQFNEEEHRRIGEITHISIPTNDLSASISMPPSRQGYFVLFDAMLDLRLWEIFTAPRNLAAWAACYVRAAWGFMIRPPYWVGPAIDHLTSIREGPYPDSYSLSSAREFVYAHECGHFFLDHLNHGLKRTLHFGEQELSAYDPELSAEIEADKFAREVLCRNRQSLSLQQMGVDWLFGFLGAVLAMRQLADAITNGRRPLPPMVHRGIARRRAEAWEDYERRRAESPDEHARHSEDVVTVQRQRENVDNFNRAWPGALAEIYAVLPKELMEWQARVTASMMSEDDAEKYRIELVELVRKTVAHPPPVIGRWRRLRQMVERMF
jgi:hypothetical protein